MLRKLITKNIYFVRGSRELFKKDSGPTITSGAFPYKFGGVSNYLPNEGNVEVFGSENKQKFINLYGNLLDAIEKKDQKWLKETVEPQLVVPLISKDEIIQVNKESPIELLFNSMSIGIGVTHAKQSKENQLMVDKHNIALYIQKDQEPSEMAKYMATGLPVLLSFHMGVRSARKLALKGSQSKNQEVHLIVMEQQASVQLQKMMGLMGNMNEKAMDSFRKLILGSSNPWHIGNIDEFLKKRF